MHPAVISLDAMRFQDLGAILVGVDQIALLLCSNNYWWHGTCLEVKR